MFTYTNYSDYCVPHIHYYSILNFQFQNVQFCAINFNNHAFIIFLFVFLLYFLEIYFYFSFVHFNSSTYLHQLVSKAAFLFFVIVLAYNKNADLQTADSLLLNSPSVAPALSLCPGRILLSLLTVSCTSQCCFSSPDDSDWQQRMCEQLKQLWPFYPTV